MSKTVTIFGATGAQGIPVVEEALARGLRVRAAARDQARLAEQHPAAEAVVADLDDPSAVTDALIGADAAFAHLPLPAAPDAPQRQLGHLLAAARAVGLPLLVFSTSGPTGERFGRSIIADGNAAAERAVLDSGVPAIVLKPTLYIENLLPTLFAPRLRTEGVLDYPPLPPERRISWTSHRDQALVAAAALERPDLAGQSFDIASHGAVSGEDLADDLTRWLGHSVRFDPARPEEFGARIAEALSNPGMGHVLTDLYTGLGMADPAGLRVDTERLEEVFGLNLSTVGARISAWSASGQAR